MRRIIEPPCDVERISITNKGRKLSILIRLLGLAAKGVGAVIEGVVEDKKHREAGTGPYSPEEVAKREEQQRLYNSAEAVAERAEKQRLRDEERTERERVRKEYEIKHERAWHQRFMIEASFPNKLIENRMTAQSAVSVLGASEALRELLGVSSWDYDERFSDYAPWGSKADMAQCYRQFFLWADKNDVFDGRVYDIDKLDEEEAYKLLCQSFRKIVPHDDYEKAWLRGRHRVMSQAERLINFDPMGSSHSWNDFIPLGMNDRKNIPNW